MSWRHNNETLECIASVGPSTAAKTIPDNRRSSGDHPFLRKRTDSTISLDRVEARVGKIPLAGRYHRPPHRIDEQYIMHGKILGQGFNGVVRLATRRTSRTQKFAVKEFKLTNVHSDKRQQLESEVEVFLCMDHPHIARLIDVYESDVHLHLVMECMDGGELFDRVIELKRFSERDAADALYQMLLALNYIHSHSIVHRDLKLENFLYERKNSRHLKLIDFGFSRLWDPNIKMRGSFGTLSYVAPEVLGKNYTSQCDLWSLGVIAFIILSGYMPFTGSERQQSKNILEGRYLMKRERWDSVSREAAHFTRSLLQVNPLVRLTASHALAHPWIAQRKELAKTEIDQGIVEALRNFGHATKFRRCCMEMMAWSLSNEERAKVRQYFIAMDTAKNGTITLSELRAVLVNRFQINDDETCGIFNALDHNADEEIHYSDFLAAMVSTRIALHDDLLRSTFMKFDTDKSGYITVENLRDLLGNTFEGEDVAQLLSEADLLQDGRVSYPEFVSYICETPLEHHVDAASSIIDKQLRCRQAGSHESPVLQRLRRMNSESGSDGFSCCICFGACWSLVRSQHQSVSQATPRVVEIDNEAQPVVVSYRSSRRERRAISA